MHPKSNQKPSLANLLWSFRREFLVVGLFSAVVNTLLLTPTLYMLQVYDRVMVSQSETTLLVSSAIVLFLFAVMAFAEWARGRLLVRTSAGVDQRLSDGVFRASFLTYLKPDSEDPAQAFSHLIALRQFLTGHGIFACFDGPWVPIYLAVLYLLHPWLGLIGAVFALIQLLVAWLGNRITRPAQRHSSQANAQAQRYMHGKLRNIEVLLSMGMLTGLYRRWHAQHAQALCRSDAAERRQAAVSGVSKFFKLAQQSLGLGAGAWLVIRGELTPGAMIAANVLMSRALAPIDTLVSSWPSFLAAKDAYRYLSELLANQPLARDQVLSQRPHGHLAAQGLTVRVPGRKQPLLNDVSAVFPPGSVTVVLGPSGAGKSTLARCLLGIWPSVEGQVLLDAQDITHWSRDSLGAHLGYLPQDVELFEGSVGDNIARMGRVDADQVIAAAKAAGVHDMILKLPQGYDTPMGQAGALLSGGQRQRVGLARALYGDPVVLVLDEPNANLDDQGEAALAAAVRAAQAKGKVVVLISHRHSALAVADRVLLLQGGRCIAGGPKDEVLPRLQQPRPTEGAAAMATA